MKQKYNFIMLIASFIIILNLLYPPRVSEMKAQDRAFIFGDVHICNKHINDDITSWTSCTIDSELLWAQNGIVLFSAFFMMLGSIYIGKREGPIPENY